MKNELTGMQKYEETRREGIAEAVFSGGGELPDAGGEAPEVACPGGRSSKATAEELFVEAMLDRRWDVVLKLVEFGLKPGKVRHSEGADNLSALGLALEAGEYEVAERLYEAGDRLDDYCNHEGPDMRFTPLALLAVWRRSGRDLFRNERASLAECCRKGLLLQAKPLLSAASNRELDRAAAALLDDGLLSAVFTFGYAGVIEFLCRIFRSGGRVSVRERDEVEARIVRLQEAPRAAWWRIDDESAAELRELVAKYTRSGGAGKGV